MNVRYPQPILLGFFVFGLFGSLGLTFMSSKVEAQTALFLTPPYWGTTYISAVFDHQFPTLYSGTPSDGNAPNGLVNRNGIRYTTGDCSLYSGHAGIDYGLVYNYVIAAHNGKVSQAGWYDPENRRHAFGLMVEIELVSTQRISQHKTIYAHLSTLLVQTGQIVTQQELIAISGNTGSTG